MRTLGAALVALALLCGTSACGSKVDDYCSALKADRGAFADMAGGDGAVAVLTHRDLLHNLGDKAPDDLSDEWHTFLAAVDNLDAALKKAGVKPSEFTNGKPPAGLDAKDRQAIAEAADGLSQPDTVAAAQGIDAEARDVCKVNLGS